jgi:hypothetical protein
MRLLKEGDLVIYDPVEVTELWEFRVGRRGVVIRNQECGDATVPVRYENEDGPAFTYVRNLVLADT